MRKLNQNIDDAEYIEKMLTQEIRDILNRIKNRGVNYTQHLITELGILSCYIKIQQIKMANLQDQIDRINMNNYGG